MEGRHREMGNHGYDSRMFPRKRISFPSNLIRSWAEIDCRVREARFATQGVYIETSSIMSNQR
jgi:hypothetical protein